MPSPKERLDQEILRRSTDHLSKHQPSGEAYEFNIKIRKVNIPDEVRGKFSEAHITDIYEFAASQRLKDFVENLKTDFPWIHDWRQDGRSGGWLVIVPNDAVLLSEFGKHVRPKMKRLKDLDEIAARVEEAKRDFKLDMESPEWWGISRSKKVPWNPREEGRGR